MGVLEHPEPPPLGMPLCRDSWSVRVVHTTRFARHFVSTFSRAKQKMKVARTGAVSFILRTSRLTDRETHRQTRQLHRRRNGSGGPAFADQCFYANVPHPLRARMVRGHSVHKHGSWSLFPRLYLTKVHETATP